MVKANRPRISLHHFKRLPPAQVFDELNSYEPNYNR